ncbi:MAG: TIGR00374 family protein, partial [Halodesulfurarchaeum sp.]
MKGRRLGAYLAGVVGAIVVFAGLFFLVGGRRILDALVAADPVLVASTLALGLCWLFAWSMMLRTVLAALDVGWVR